MPMRCQRFFPNRFIRFKISPRMIAFAGISLAVMRKGAEGIRLLCSVRRVRKGYGCL